MPKITRLTLFKIPDSTHIDQAIAKYATLTQDAVKVRTSNIPGSPQPSRSRMTYMRWIGILHPHLAYAGPGISSHADGLGLILTSLEMERAMHMPCPISKASRCIGSCGSLLIVWLWANGVNRMGSRIFPKRWHSVHMTIRGIKGSHL